MKTWGRRGCLLLLLGWACLLSACGTAESERVDILQDGTVIRTVDLSAVTEEESFTVQSMRGTNTIRIAPGEIRMASADCPDQICVKSGKLLEDGLPIVCLPHRVVIQWAN